MNDGGARRLMPEVAREPLSEQARRLLAAAKAFARTDVLAIRDANVTLPLVDILDALPDFIYVKDRQSRFVYANEATAHAHGLERAADLLGKTDFDLYLPAKAEEFHAAEQDLMSATEAWIVLGEEFSSADGKPFWRRTTKAVLKNPRRDVVGLVGIAHDITDCKREHLLLKGQAQLLEMIARSEPLPGILDALVRLVEAELDGVSCSILLLDREEGRLHVGAAPLWADYCGLAAEFGLRSCWSTPILAPGQEVLGTFALYSDEVRTPTRRETELVAMATHLAGIAAERRRTEERIRFMAHHDPLTGLPNRSFFQERLADALEVARTSGHPVSLAYIDVDNFKVVNDTLGHTAGDGLLRELAGRMSACLRGGDVVARLGGDEFAVAFAHQSCDDRAVDERLHDLHAAIGRPVAIGDEMIAASCSMGVAVFPLNGLTPEQLLSSADAAMYKAKQNGRNNIQRL